MSLSVSAVKLTDDGKGEIVNLEAGSIVAIQGTSPIPGFIEVECHGEPFSVFEEDVRDRAVLIRPGRPDE